MSAEESDSRPAGNGPASKSLTNHRQSTARTDSHGALLAADAVAWFNRLHWEREIHCAAKTGLPFSSDDLQAERGLPDIGNATGGVFMALHRAGVIRRVGYRASNKHSRAGGVVAIWTGGDTA